MVATVRDKLNRNAKHPQDAKALPEELSSHGDVSAGLSQVVEVSQESQRKYTGEERAGTLES